jgi:hypothetical protein
MEIMTVEAMATSEQGMAESQTMAQYDALAAEFIAAHPDASRRPLWRYYPSRQKDMASAVSTLAATVAKKLLSLMSTEDLLAALDRLDQREDWMNAHIRDLPEK